MDVIISNKAAYTFVALLSVLVFVLGAGAAVNINDAYHALQDVVDNDGRSVDFDNDGVIDSADSAVSFDYPSLSDASMHCPVNGEGVQTFAVGFGGGNSLECMPAQVACTNDGGFSCSASFSGSVISSGGSGYVLRPEFVASEGNFLWAVSIINDEEGMLVKFDCSQSPCAVVSMRRLQYPRQIAVKDNVVYVGSEPPAGVSSGVYVVSDSGCSVSPAVSPKGVVVAGGAVFVADGSAVKKYSSFPGAPSLIYTDASLSFSDLSAGTFSGVDYVFARASDASDGSVVVLNAGTMKKFDVFSSLCSYTAGSVLGGVAVDDVNKKLYALCEVVLAGTDVPESAVLYEHTFSYLGSSFGVFAPPVVLAVASPQGSSLSFIGLPFVDTAHALYVPFNGGIAKFASPPPHDSAIEYASIVPVNLGASYENGCG